MVWLVLLIGLATIGLTRMPIGMGLGLIGLFILKFIVGDAESLAVNAVWDVLSDFTLAAIPLFIFMGEILLVSGVSSRIYNALTPFFRNLPGGLLHSNIAVCTVFGAVSGASTSTAAAIGSVAYPELSQRGYDKPLLVASLAAGGTLGLLIPPSLSLLLYGVTQGVSIGRLFLAGVLPGIVLALMFMLLIALLGKRKNKLKKVISSQEENISLGRKLYGLLQIWPVAFIAFAVLGTLYMGLATPTEAAALGVVASIVTGIAWGGLGFFKLWEAFLTSVKVFGAIAVVLIGALILSQSLTVLGLPQELAVAMVDAGLGKYQVLLAVTVLYLVLGCFFDGISLLLMTIPIMYPVLMAAGFDPVWTGVIITILIEIGMITPPVGMNLFVLTALTNGEVTLGKAAMAAIPFWLTLLVGIALFTLVPGIVLWLPDLVMGAK